MKIYRITDLAGTWWAEIATADMKTQDNQTIVQMRSKYSTNAINLTDIAPEIVALGLWNQVGRRFTEIELIALCAAKNFNLSMIYESDAAITKYTALTLQATPTFSPVAGEVAIGDTITIVSASADNIYYTLDGTEPTVDSTDQAVTACEIVTLPSVVKAIAVQDGYATSLVGSAVYTQRDADAPTVALAVGDTNPVGGVTDVALPAAGETDETGAVTGWTTGTADEIKFTVTDGDGTSTITINDVAYISGDEYTIAAATDLTIVVTTVETGAATTVRTFIVTVAAA